jgi:hypothetical protein
LKSYILWKIFLNLKERLNIGKHAIVLRFLIFILGMVIGTASAWAEDPYVPKEITSSFPGADYPFTHAKSYSVTFKTDSESLKGILPTEFRPVPVYAEGESLLLTYFNFKRVKGRLVPILDRLSSISIFINRSIHMRFPR